MESDTQLQEERPTDVIEGFRCMMKKCKGFSDVPAVYVLPKAFDLAWYIQFILKRCYDIHKASPKYTLCYYISTCHILFFISLRAPMTSTGFVLPVAFWTVASWDENQHTSSKRRAHDNSHLPS